jgi:transcriptional regulator with XRE-family HTH domain
MANEFFVTVDFFHRVWYYEVNAAYPEVSMELGERIKQARLDAGLSQRQLCGDTVTRNMLSLIESGRARPSMDTLAYFARQLGKPMGYFLEEQAVLSPNQEVMEQAEKALAAGDFQQTLSCLESYQAPDGLFDGRRQVLTEAACLGLARVAIQEEKKPFALSLLERAGQSREALLLRYSLQPEKARELAVYLPPITDELLLRAQAALDGGKTGVAAAYLDAAEERNGRWYLLRGRAHMAAGEFSAAVGVLRKAEKEFSKVCLPLLERCYKELGEYQRAYEYACKRREEG